MSASANTHIERLQLLHRLDQRWRSIERQLLQNGQKHVDQRQHVGANGTYGIQLVIGEYALGRHFARDSSSFDHNFVEIGGGGEIGLC